MPAAQLWRGIAANQPPKVRLGKGPDQPHDAAQPLPREL
jgi:hypothetical protein